MQTLIQALRRSAGVATLCCLALVSARADEGLWLFSHPPREALRQAHGFELTDAWLDHAMKASVRFGGASGSFVSADGLVLTNHHVGRSAIQRLSTATRNLEADGFLATAPADELPVPGMELSVLQSIEDVTARVSAAVGAAATPEAAAAARRGILAEIEAESLRQTGLLSRVITLYQGGWYHLYRYKNYTDVRLVFAPEDEIAAFGGDADNFEYPRYCLDMCLFRVYEGGRPARVEHYLRWAKEPARAGDLVLVSGHPGRTDRQLTLAELLTLRDVTLPQSLESLQRTEVVLTAWGGRDAENQRRAARVLDGVLNNRKRTTGQLGALQDPAFFAGLVSREADLKARLQAAGEERALRALERIAAGEAERRTAWVRTALLEQGGAFRGQLFGYARDLVRVAAERAKPDGQRLREYSDARRQSFELSLLSVSPVHEDLERVLLADSLGRMVELLGAEDPTVVRVLAGRSPRARAVELVAGTRLADPAFRRAIYSGQTEGADADAMLALARLVDAEARTLRAAAEARAEASAQAHSDPAAARFRLMGGSQYPDATGTLRLSYGTVSGYREDGVEVPFQTVTAGLYERHALQKNRVPFTLPDRWVQGRDRLAPGTPFNFVATTDIVGGNSGSPVLNRRGELVGLVFDGNLASLAIGFAYDDATARAVHVAAPIMLESLRAIYGASALVAEIENGRLAP
jgi:hypothetical protein